ncbi:MAG: indole-3-glycerol-phosphate synthase [Anaerolineae bacterium]|nr:indole-3-glycerol-phosphate synthase [Anaerolineae bacterium]
MDATPSLDDIIAHTRKAVEARKAQTPRAAVHALAQIQYRRRRPLDVVSWLRNDKLSLIAQVKRATLTRGRLFEAYDPVHLARLFEHNGAAAVTVSTERRYYEGGLDHLAMVKEAVHVPVWCHDFVVDEYQLYEIRAAGADGLMLLPMLLDDLSLRRMVSLTQRLGMTAMVPVRNEEEVMRARRVDPRVVGISYRDPFTHRLDLDLPARLRPLFRSHTTVIAMGGICTLEDAQRMAAAGMDGVLVGEALLTAGDIAAQVRALSSLAVPPADFRRSLDGVS